MKVAAAILLVFCVYVSARFTEVHSSAGINYNQQPPYGANDANCLTDPCYIQNTTGGASVADFDNDGWPDIYVTRLLDRNEGDNIVLIPDILYKNMGDGTFRDVTEEVGLGSFRWFTVAPTFCDFDNDGDLDLFVTTVCPTQFMDDERNRNYLFIYENGQYVDRTFEWGVAQADGRERVGMAATCGDINGDGFVDLFVAQWTPRPQSELNEIDYASHTKLYRNNNGMNFVDITDLNPDMDIIVHDREHNFAGEFVDWDKDGDADLLISADFNHSQYFKNNGNGRFTSFTEESGCCEGSNDMGTAFGDIDNNGELDWFLTSMGLYPEETTSEDKMCLDEICGNRLYLNNDGQMRDLTTDAGVRRGGWGWGAAFFDVENDGDLDLAMTNGHYTLPLTGSNGWLWMNENGVHNGLVDRTEEMNFMDPFGFGLSLLTLDYDRDGDLDVFISHCVDGGALFRNDVNNNNDWLQVKTPGMGAPNTNYFGKGTQITVMSNNKIYYQEMGVNSPLLGHSQSDMVHFGLGQCRNGVVDSLEVYFPASGIRHHLRDVRCNQVFTVAEGGNYDEYQDSSDNSNSNNSNSNSDSSSDAWTIIPSLFIIALCLLF